MALLMRSIFLGYGSAAFLAAALGASMLGWVLAWIGGSVLALGFAVAGSLIWPASDEALQVGDHADLWAEDLAADRFAADLAADRAATAGQNSAVQDRGAAAG